MVILPKVPTEEIICNTVRVVVLAVAPPVVNHPIKVRVTEFNLILPEISF